MSKQKINECMKKKEYIQPELAVVEVELQRMIALSGQLDTTPANEIDDPDDIGSREDGFFGF